MAPADDCTLHFFDAPAVATPQAARSHLDETADAAPPALAQRFARLVEALSQVYPDLRTSPDPSYQEANVWPRGLPSQAAPGCALSLAFNPKFAERGVFAVAAACAMRFGLQMLDARNGVLYLADGSLVRSDGSTARCRGVTPFAADLMRHPSPREAEPDRPALRTLLAAGLHAMLTFQGFERVEDGEGVLFTRLHGEIRQTVSLQFQRFGGPWIAYTVVWLQAPALVEEWLPLLGPKAAAWYAHHHAQHGGLSPDMQLSMPYLHPQAPWAFSSFHFSRAFERQHDVPPYLGGWCDWLSREGAAELDRIRDLQSLADTVLSEEMVRDLWAGRYSPAHQACALALAYRVAPEKFDRVCRQLRTNLKNEREGWAELDDPRLHHLERLIVGLRKPFG